MYLLFKIKFAHSLALSAGADKNSARKLFLNQEDTVKDVSSSAVGQARPPVRKLGARLAFRSEVYPAQYRRGGRPVDGSQVTARFPGKRQ